MSKNRVTRAIMILGGMVVMGVLAGLFSSGAKGDVGLRVGDPIPDLTLSGSGGKKYSLRDGMSRGEGLIIVWIPKTFTPR
jgi:hypothetical protein